jgi:hypothetical protein
MLANLPPEITIGSFTIIGTLTAYIWNSQGKRIDEIKKVQESRPCPRIAANIEAIKTDISWIKSELTKN